MGPGCKISYLGHLAEIGRKLQAGDVASLVPNNYDGVDGIELDVSDLVLLLGDHWLAADRLILVDAQVKHVGLWRENGQQAWSRG